MSDNLPAGVSHSHDYFNPPEPELCPSCENEIAREEDHGTVGPNDKPCPQAGKSRAELEEDKRAAYQESKMEQRRLERKMDER